MKMDKVERERYAYKITLDALTKVLDKVIPEYEQKVKHWITTAFFTGLGIGLLLAAILGVIIK